MCGHVSLMHYWSRTSRTAHGFHLQKRWAFPLEDVIKPDIAPAPKRGGILRRARSCVTEVGRRSHDQREKLISWRFPSSCAHSLLTISLDNFLRIASVLSMLVAEFLASHRI